ncbi:MAG: hypothetical protein ABI723_16115 [Bacteroidia bacterium]
MAVYKFRVTFEDYDDVSRDIEIRPAQTFKDFHTIIQQSIKFDAGKPATFFMSTDNWTKEKEISLEPKKNKDGSDVALMENSVLGKFIIDPHQKIYYIFDTWTFFIELIKINLTPDAKATYPRCIKINGEAPPQYKKIILPAVEETDAVDELLLMDEEDEVEADETGNGVEVFEDDHGLEGEEREEGSEVEESADEEPFEEI